jgi:glycerol-3-phosphate dehydrogenase subunit B
MKFDSLIIGGGLAGLACGVRLASAGRRCAVVTSGQSALHFSSGSFDLLNALPDGEAVTAPQQAIETLIAQAPQHPYALLGAERFTTYATEASALLREAGIAVVGDATHNHYRLSPIGELRPTWLTCADYLHTDTSASLPWKRVAVVSLAGYIDFYSSYLIDGLQLSGATCVAHTLHLGALDALRQNPTEMRAIQIARLLDRQTVLDELLQLLRRVISDEEAVLLPAVLGLERIDVCDYLSSALNRPVALLATLPTSVCGYRMQQQLIACFRRLGGMLLAGDTVVRAQVANNRVQALYTVAHDDEPLEAEHVILASGGIFSQGLVAEQTALREPLFDLDVDTATDRNEWYNRDLFAKQPFARFGVRTTADFQALRGGVPIENLHVIGASLAGFDAVTEGCGAGVSLLTALCVADQIIK